MDSLGYLITKPSWSCRPPSSSKVGWPWHFPPMVPGPQVPVYSALEICAIHNVWLFFCECDTGKKGDNMIEGQDDAAEAADAPVEGAESMDTST